MSSVDMPETRKEEPEQKPGAGIDRTVMRKMLALTPAQRAAVIVESGRNYAAVRAYVRRR